MADFGPGRVGLPGLGAVSSASIPNDVTLSTAAYTEIFKTGSLGVGTWLLSASATVANGNATAGTVEMVVVVSSATATFSGAQSAQSELPAIAGGCTQIELAVVVTVTGAGTFSVQVKAPGASASTAKKLTPNSSTTQATGYTALQVA